eukprot:gene8751-9645_t
MTTPTETSTSYMKEYKWLNSYSLPYDLQCGVIRLEFSGDISVEVDVPEVLSVEATIVCNQFSMNDPPALSLYSQSDNSKNIHNWNNLLSFSIKVRDLSLDSVIALTVRDENGRVFCGTSMRIFDENGSMKQGKQKLMVFFGKAGDPNVVMEENTTPGEYYEHFAQYDQKFKMEKRMEAYKMASNQNGSNAWLDKLLLKRIEETLHLAPNEDQANGEIDDIWGKPSMEYEMGRYSFIIIELPLWPHPVLYEEKQYQSVVPHYPPTARNELLTQCISEHDEQLFEFSLVGRPFNASWLTVVADWDMDQENLAEDLNRRLSHNVRRGSTDATTKPNKDEKKRIDKILQSVGNQLSTEDLDFLYRFRYSLTENKKALTKFLYAVNWDEESEVAELPTLLALWKERAPIDVADALKLLSKEKSFEHQYVREFAVNVLRSASDEELLTFLLQLVQALRYEPAGSTGPVANTSLPQGNSSEDLLQTDYMLVGASMIQPSTQESFEQPQQVNVSNHSAAEVKISKLSILSPLGNFLLERACNSPAIANYFYWYLKVETCDENSGGFFSVIYDSFVQQLTSSSAENAMVVKRLMALDNYIREILQCQRDAIKQGRRRDAKEQLLQKHLEVKNSQRWFDSIGWVPMPLDPSIKLSGLIPNTAKMFASAVYPCVIEFIELPETPQTVEGEGDASTASVAPKTHKIMFKSGDDLRQDQLIMQMISLMDSLLKKVNLDLKLLTYGILAVGQTDGIMEFVLNSMPISAIMRNYGSIHDYLMKHNHDKNGPYEISPLAFDTFVKSCAGYCVITFILGIGDRHLDNIMINTAGQLFHIDFGFIFGQDPKPLPPPFRFTKSMADAMGGEDSEHYAKFKSYCCQSYNWLRKSANLILNLLSLMGDAGINDISKRSDLSKVLLKVEEKFRLDLSDEQAEQYFLGLINESLHSIAPKIMEVAHKIAVAMR